MRNCTLYRVAKPLLRGLAGLLFLVSPIVFIALPAQSHSDPPPTAAELAAEIKALKQDYEARIRKLEAQLEAIDARPAAAAAPPTGAHRQHGAFAPAIGVTLNGALSNFSAEVSEISGFQLGHESARGREGLALIETELSVSANIDDKFFGSAMIGIHAEEDGTEAADLEEAYVRTLPGAGLPAGLRVTAGRALWTLGSLNEQHPPEDDFVDRPLPYRVFINRSYNDDGLEFAYAFPTDMFAEAGAGLFRGDDFPFGGSATGRGAMSAYARLGNDIGANRSFRIGAYVLDGAAVGRGVAHAHGGEDDHAGDMHDDRGEDDHADDVHDDHDDGVHDDDHADDHADDVHDDHETAGGDVHEEHYDLLAKGMFTGDTTLYGFDVRYTWAPTGNPRNQEVALQGEYFWRAEDGVYANDEGEMAYVDGTSSGWYLQGAYKFNPAWRLGLRYSRLDPVSPADVTGGEYEVEHNPSTVSLMGEWMSSGFGRIRLQLNRESLNQEVTDNQLYLQYVMNLGTHGAHRSPGSRNARGSHGAHGSHAH